MFARLPDSLLANAAGAVSFISRQQTGILAPIHG